MIFPILFGSLLFVLLAVDFVFFPRGARRAWVAMAVAFGGGALGIAFPWIMRSVATALGLWRGTDLILYLLAVVAVREFFFARYRFEQSENALTELVRGLAIRDAEELTGLESSRERVA